MSVKNGEAREQILSEGLVDQLSGLCQGQSERSPPIGASRIGEIGVAALAVVSDQLAGKSAVDQRHQVVDISLWRVHNGWN